MGRQDGRDPEMVGTTIERLRLEDAMLAHHIYACVSAEQRHHDQLHQRAARRPFHETPRGVRPWRAYEIRSSRLVRRLLVAVSRQPSDMAVLPRSSAPDQSRL